MNVQALDHLSMMKGTGGDKDYYIVATTGCLALGVKPIFDAASDSNGMALHVGYRVRIANNPNHNGTATMDVDAEAKKLFPMFQADNRDKSRVSLYRGKFGAIGAADVDAELQSLKSDLTIGNTLGELRQILKTACDDVLQTGGSIHSNVHTFVNDLTNGYIAEINQILCQSPNATAATPAKPTGGFNNVVDASDLFGADKDDWEE